MTTDSSPAPEGEPSLPDEVWEQFLQDSERGIRASAAPREPSARARIVARRLREEEQRAAAERKRRRGNRYTKRSARRSGGTDPVERRRPRSGRLRGLLSVVVVVILLLVVLSPGRAWSFIRGNGWHDGGSPGPVPTTVVPQPRQTMRT